MASTQPLDQLMERASQALLKRNYPKCESFCWQALRKARTAGLWNYYARIILPLQEARRHRRLSAAEGAVRLGTNSVQTLTPPAPLDAGPWCLVLTGPATPAQAQKLHAQNRSQFLLAEILLVQESVTDDQWTVRSIHGPAVQVTLPAPPLAWRDRWIPPAEKIAPAPDHARPGDWFLAACEKLGDAALAQVTALPGTVARIEALEACLLAATHHEILHQRLAEAALAAALLGSSASAK